MQSHEQPIEYADPGRRLAVNLRGVEKSDLQRGDVLSLPGTCHPTTLLDAWLRYLPAAQLPLEHDDPVKLFTGAAEVSGRVRVLDRERVFPGEQSWIQIRLDAPLAAMRGDRYIIRRASPPETIGGGVILDTAPGQRWKRFRPDVIARFETLHGGDPVEIALLELAGQRGPSRRESLHLTPEQLDQGIRMGEMIPLGVSGWVIHRQAWARLVDKSARVLANWHAAEPLRLGMPRDALRSRLRLDPEPFEAVLSALAEQGIIAVARNGVVRLPDHTVRLSEAQQNSLDRLWREFERAPHAPPTAAQARDLVGDGVLNTLLDNGDLVQISSEVLLMPAALHEWIVFARGQLERGEPLTVAVLRDHFGTTRRYALDFLERLDALGITRRKGDERILGSGDWERLSG